VLLLILDTVRAASLGLYGGPNPNSGVMGALAERGIMFDRAIAPTSWTLPTHASMFTGLWPVEHGADWSTPLDPGHHTLAEELAQRGYRTGAFVANLAYATREHGLARGFQVYREHDRSVASLARAASIPRNLLTSNVVRQLIGYYDIAGRKRAADVNREFLAWHAGVRESPWFAFLNYFDAHEPYRPGPGYVGRYSDGLPPQRQDAARFWNSEGGIASWRTLSPAEMAREQAAYDEAIAELDDAVGTLLAELDRQGQASNTLVIITSDHGEQFGEQGLHTHGNSLYWPSLHVPLIILPPGGQPTGLRVAMPVSLRDIATTVMDAVAPGEESPFPGTSLLRVAAGGHEVPWPLATLTADAWIRTEGPTSNGDLFSVIGPDWQYIRAANGAEELFPIVGGSASSVNMAATAEWRAVVDTARAWVATWESHRRPNQSNGSVP
jgi:arylsulfatase A-like enzyme